MPAVARIDPKDVFTHEEWARFSKRSSWLGLACVDGAWGLIFAAGAMFVLWPNPLTYILAVMLIGARQLGRSSSTIRASVARGRMSSGTRRLKCHARPERGCRAGSSSSTVILQLGQPPSSGAAAPAV